MGADHDRDSNPYSHCWEVSALPLSYPREDTIYLNRTIEANNTLQMVCDPRV